MLVRNLAELRSAGIEDAAHHAAAFLAGARVDAVWLHIDADCLDDDVMPAVDWRDPGGMTADELTHLSRLLLKTGLVVGMDVTIYNPGLDTSELTAGRLLTDIIGRVLR